jgi:hypothetical protein
MASGRGLIAINNVANSSKQNSFSTFTNMGLNSLIITGRVISIVLDETHPRFQEFGEWNGLGTIEFDLIDSPTPPNQLYSVAKPLDPSVKSLPLINEVVYILALPNTGIGEFASTKTNYYINTIGIWNHPHHNAFPQNSNILPPSQQKDYVQTELGSVRRVTDQSTEIFLGRTFVERGNIHPLLPFEGDKIIEGRWGNSIRLGSTVKNTLNTWSSTGTNGDPITIIRNGQGNQTEEGWVPTVEDINNDDTSIYFTSTQKIPLEASSTNDYFSYKNNPPSKPNEYAGKQIILNSGRLVFNTTEDHLLLSSKKSINLNAVESINFDTTGPTVLQSGEIYLGSKNATEPILLGQSTINLLQTLLQELATLTNILSLQVGVPPGAPLAPTNTQAALTNATITNLITQLNGLMSNSVKTV